MYLILISLLINTLLLNTAFAELDANIGLEIEGHNPFGASEHPNKIEKSNILNNMTLIYVLLIIILIIIIFIIIRRKS